MPTRKPQRISVVFGFLSMLVLIILMNWFFFMSDGKRFPRKLFVNILEIPVEPRNLSILKRSILKNCNSSWLQQATCLIYIVSRTTIAQSGFELKILKETATDKRPKPPEYHAVTYASHRGSDERFCMALESAARHKIPLIILGWGVPWRGLFQKLEAAMNLTSSLSPNDVVLFVDAFDIFFTNTSSEVNFSS